MQGTPSGTNQGAALKRQDCSGQALACPLPDGCGPCGTRSTGAGALYVGTVELDAGYSLSCLLAV